MSYRSGPPPESLEQFLFHSWQRLLLHRYRGPGKQAFSEPFLFREPPTALPAFFHVSQRAISSVHLDCAFSRQIGNDRFYFLAIHTKALFVAFSFSSNIPRARCRRERTVPNAHPNTAAAST